MAQKVSEQSLDSMSQGPGQTESTKCDNAVRAIRNALDACEALDDTPMRVFAQGSYRARTNVRQNSDVDICVCYTGSVIFADYSGGTSREGVGNSASEFKFADFKNDIGTALTDYFGEDGVTRGTKAFTVHENTYRIDADVVPVLVHKRYTGGLNPDGSHAYLEGVAFNPDTGGNIINWPQQTYDNGVARNAETSRYYKRTIRILKRLRDKMQGNKIVAANNVASFLIECLVWNTPVEYLNRDTHTKRVRAVLMHVFNNTLKQELCSEWGEVNELKYLFRTAQPWTREQAHAFVSAVWDYIGFE
jgi:hypothetical protein